MASRPEARQLTEAHRLAQARLGAITSRDMLSAWRLIDPNDLDATVPEWLRIAEALISRNRDTSTALAAAYLRRFRAIEAGTTAALKIVTVPAAAEAVRTSLLVTGPITVKKATAAGLPIEAASSRGATSSARSALRHSLDGGRSTITATVEADPTALGWARATSGSPCAFCALMAGRGAVYRSEGSANFQPHDGCACQPEPIYRRDAELPAGSQRYADLYDEAAKGSDDPLNAFRRAFESSDT